MSSSIPAHFGLYPWFNWKPLSQSVNQKLDDFDSWWLFLFLFLTDRFFISREEAYSIHSSFLGLHMWEIHRSHVLIIDILDGKIRQSATISELVTSEVDLSANVCVVNVVLAPLFQPDLRLEGHRERARHLDSFSNWQVRWCFLIEKP